MKILFNGLAIVVGLGLLVIVGLIGLAARAPEPVSLAQALTTLSAAERDALATATRAAGTTPEALRLVYDARGPLFDNAVNAHAVVIEGGHVIGLSLQSNDWNAVPDFSTLTSLRSLHLAGSGLPGWPRFDGLHELQFLDLSGQPLGASTPTLPLSLQTLRLARSAVGDLAPLAGLSGLRSLDLSATRVKSIEAIVGLALDSLRLVDTPIEQLPQTLPTRGAWKLDLDGTRLVQPSGYVEQWPFNGMVQTSRVQGDRAHGRVARAGMDVQGVIAEQSETRGHDLPETMDSDVGTVVVRLSLEQGHVRVWLEEPPELFSSPWFREGKVKGFGAMRRRGYVFADLKAGQTFELRGGLRHGTRDTYYDHARENRKQARLADNPSVYSFFVEPLDGPIRGLRYQFRNAKDTRTPS